MSHTHHYRLVLVIIVMLPNRILPSGLASIQWFRIILFQYHSRSTYIRLTSILNYANINTMALPSPSRCPHTGVFLACFSRPCIATPSSQCSSSIRSSSSPGRNTTQSSSFSWSNVSTAFSWIKQTVSRT